MTIFNPPKRAIYTPIPGKLRYPVRVTAERMMFGRHEYEIFSEEEPISRCWVTVGQDGQQLQFEEGQP